MQPSPLTSPNHSASGTRSCIVDALRISWNTPLTASYSYTSMPLPKTVWRSAFPFPLRSVTDSMACDGTCRVALLALLAMVLYWPWGALTKRNCVPPVPRKSQGMIRWHVWLASSCTVVPEPVKRSTLYLSVVPLLSGHTNPASSIPFLSVSRAEKNTSPDT